MSGRQDFKSPQVQLSHDGSQLVSIAGDRRQVRLWNAETGAVITEWREQRGTLDRTFFSPHGDLAALSGSYDSVSSSGALAEQNEVLITGLRMPLVVTPTLEGPADMAELEESVA